MDWYRFAGTALVVGVIGPLFWLGVNVLSNKLGSWLHARARVWGGEQTGTKQRLFKHLARLWAAGQKPLF